MGVTDHTQTHTQTHTHTHTHTMKMRVADEGILHKGTFQMGVTDLVQGNRLGLGYGVATISRLLKIISLFCRI